MTLKPGASNTAPTHLNATTEKQLDLIWEMSDGAKPGREENSENKNIVHGDAVFMSYHVLFYITPPVTFGTDLVHFLSGTK